MLNHTFDLGHAPALNGHAPALNGHTPVLNGHATPAQQFAQAEFQLYWHLLDDVHHRLLESFETATIHLALDELFLALRERKRVASEAEWRSFVTLARRHPIVQVLHQDPFTFRAFSKPRGYAGDALMMDYIYGREDRLPPPPAEPLGRQVFDYTTLAPASEGVRARRAFMASRIDRLAEKRNRPHILSIAAGHLREAGLSVAVRRRCTGRFVALDADNESAAEVRDCYSAYGVETITASFRRLLGKKHGAGEFDLVYSTGLFDYLNQRVARKLVTSMFQMLRPRGSLIVANFLPDVRDVGYMETFMDWNLIYRSRSEMVDLTSDIPEADVREVKLVSEECKNIIFLQVTKG